MHPRRGGCICSAAQCHSQPQHHSSSLIPFSSQTCPRISHFTHPHFSPPQTAAPILALETLALPSSSPKCHGCLWQHPHPFFPWSLGRGERWGFFGIRKRLRRRTATCADRQTDGCFALPEPTLLPPLPAGPDCRGLACNELLPDLAPGGKAAARAPASSPWEGICLRHRS